jgi:DNA-binding transcriptional ArsR family regulator
VSAKLFGNEKLVEVVLALHAANNTATAQQLAKATGIDHAMVRVVLIRLVDAGLLDALPRANTRAAQYYAADNHGQPWLALCTLARAVWVDAEIEASIASPHPDS